MNHKVATTLIGIALLAACARKPADLTKPASPSLAPVYSMKPKAPSTISTRTPDLVGGNESEHRGGMPEQGQLRHDPSFSHILFYTGSREAKKVSLTFDDGPDDRFTPEILRILRENRIRATFFYRG